MVIKRTKQFIKDYPTYTVLLSLLMMICLGAGILALPICRHMPINIIDLFFVSTSLITVTGLTTIPFDMFTNIGQIAILIMIQIGGLGLMTMSLFIMALFVNFGLYTQILAREILSIQSFKDTRRILFFIIRLTLLCELIGAIITFFVIKNDFSFNKALFLSAFHAVSCFCNVGIALFPQGALSYNTNSIMLITTTLLIMVGSLGFVTWHEFFKIIKNWKRDTPNHKISWHTHLVLKTFFLTALITTILFWLLECNNAFSSMSWIISFLNTILMSFSMKSCGYLSIAINSVCPATILLIGITTLIGSAPSSTGSGIKTSAFAIFLATIKATIRGRTNVEIHGRTICKEQTYKALSIISLSCSWILVITFLLLITETRFSFIDILFEAISAFANNGLSLGITPDLTIIGKLLIMLTMIAGRIGALILIIGMSKSSEINDFSYPEERVILG